MTPFNLKLCSFMSQSLPVSVKFNQPEIHSVASWHWQAASSPGGIKKSDSESESESLSRSLA